MTASPNPIERSFEIAAERCDDLTPLVYRRLHHEHPETISMFRTEGSELVKGSMLALTIEAMLDFAGPRTGHFRMIECEITSHNAYGTPRDLVHRILRRDRRHAARGFGGGLVAGDRCGVAEIAGGDRKRRRPERGLVQFPLEEI